MLQLNIDPEFQEQIPPLTDEEFEQLQKNILEDGEVYEPIIVWNSTIVDGHNRWKIICENWESLKDKFRTKEMDFPDKWAAFDWMYRKQLGRRNLTEEQRTYMIGKLYEARKQSLGGNYGNQYTKMATGQNVQKPNQQGRKKWTAESIGDEYGITSRSVQRAEKYSQGIDTLKDVSADAAEKVLAGQSNVTKKMINELPKMGANVVEEIATAIVNGGPIPRQRMKVERKAESNHDNPEELEAIIADMYDRSTVPEYTVDSLVYEIQLCANEYVQQIQNTLKDRSEVLTAENKPIIAEAINHYIIENFEKVRDSLK